ncbi:phage distal tail protein [Clostridium gasigenes]|uniref:Phage-related protein n=1 Tax=Clostridium gasigenes TaxID=94869 RepID=A0A1H0N722_9CLOT|nr:phage tail family protein [Clostridium gasigenes]SDO88285.1 Phage-related protein [Clostridium gasigenes]
MLISNIDIKNFGAELLDKNISTAEFTSNKEWLKNAYKPLILSKENKYTSIRCSFVLKANNRQELEEQTSHFLKKMEECIIKFDDIEFYYNCTMQSKSNEYIGIDIRGNLETESIEVMFLSDYKYKPEITEVMNRITSKTINVAGNLETPCIVEITPTIDIIDSILEGLADDPIIIRNLKGSKTVILDGELQKVTVDGVNKYGDTDMWDFPSLQPGTNSLKFSRNNCDIKIKYKPRFI